MFLLDMQIEGLCGGRGIGGMSSSCHICLISIELIRPEKT